MANIERQPNGGWRARYYDHAGKQHVKRSPRKIDAKAWIDALTASVLSEASTVVCTSGLSCTPIIDIHLTGGRIACPLSQGGGAHIRWISHCAPMLATQRAGEGG
jgi:hypothetical protein